jgi:hypothetical protein
LTAAAGWPRFSFVAGFFSLLGPKPGEGALSSKLADVAWSHSEWSPSDMWSHSDIMNNPQ